MSEKFKVPLLRSPEVEKEKVPEALEAEQMAYEYAVKEEEVMSILDEFSNTLTFEALFKCDNYKDLPESFRNVLEKAGKKRSSGGEKKHYLNGRYCLRLWESNPEVFNEAAYFSIRGEQEETLKRILSSSDQSKKTDIEKQINDRTAGLLIRISDLAFGHLDDNLADLGKLGRFNPEESKQKIDEVMGRAGEAEAIDEDEEKKRKISIARIRAYRRKFGEDFIKQEEELDDVVGGLEIFKASKYPGAIRTNEERAEIYFKGNVDKAARSKEMVASILKKHLGYEVPFSAEEKHDQIGNLVNKDFMTAYVNYRRQMEYLHELMQNGEIVETDAVKEIVERAMPSLTKNPPTIVYFHGDFGTGKTALAKHISRTKLLKEPIIVSGSKFLEPDRFTEEFKIAKQSQADFVSDLSKKMSKRGKKVELTESSSLYEIMKVLLGTEQDFRSALINGLQKEKYLEELKRHKKGFTEEGFAEYKKANSLPEEQLQFIDKQLENLLTNDVQGRYVLGAMYKAMSEGTPLIIDEANAIPPEVLITFNDLLTKRFGDKVTTRTDKGEITVKKGFCIMWTGNSGTRYNQARYQDIDPASFSRIHPIEVHYLPQNREFTSMDEVLGKLDLSRLSQEVSEQLQSHDQALDLVKDSKTRAKGDQIFQVLLLKLMNERLGTHMIAEKEDPYSTVKDLYRLSMGARLIMDLFEDDVSTGFSLPNIENIVGSGTATNLSEKLKKSNLTMRELIDNIIGGYIDEGGAMDLEYYVYNFIRKNQQNSEEQAILYATLRRVGFFDPSEGWPDYQQMADMKEFKRSMDYCDPMKLDKYKKIDQNGIYGSLLNTQGAYYQQYFSSFEMLQLLFGYLPPRRQEEYAVIQKDQQEALAAASGEGGEKMTGEQEQLHKDISDLQRLLLAPDAAIKLTLDILKSFRSSAERLMIFNKEILNLRPEEFQARMVEYVSVMRKLMVDVGYMTADQSREIEELTPEEQVKFMTGLVSGKKSS